MSLLAPGPDGQTATGNPELERWTSIGAGQQAGIPDPDAGPFQHLREYWLTARGVVDAAKQSRELPEWNVPPTSVDLSRPLDSLLEIAQGQQVGISVPSGTAGISGQLPDGAPVVGGDVTPGFREEERLSGEQERLREFAKRVLGLEDRDPMPHEMLGVWNSAIDQMETAQELGMDPQDPWHWLDQMADNADAEAAAAAELETSKEIQRFVSLTDSDTASVVIRAAMQRILRRDPNEEEIQAFVAALNEKEQASPQVTTTTTDPNEDGTLTVTEKIAEGGAPDPNAFADMYIDDLFSDERDIEYVGTDVFAALQEALAAPA